MSDKQLIIRRIWQHHPKWIIGCLALMLLVSGCSIIRGAVAEPTPTATPAPTPVPINIEVCETLWQTINDNYVYADFNGVDWQQVRDQYLSRARVAVSETEIARVLDDMANELPDGAVVVQTRAERIQTDATDNSNFEGIGAFVAFRTQPDPHVVLLTIIPDSPAESAGLQAHESILAIDGVPVREEEGISVVERIRGPAGGLVVLTVRAPNQQIRDVRVTRGRVVATARLEANLVPGTNLSHYLFPPVAYQELSDDFASFYESLSTSGTSGLILDLRIANAKGGWPLDLLLTIFSNGNLGEFYTRNEVSPVVVEGQDVANSQNLPMAILIGPDTGGLPELFAAMMQARGRATIIGMPTDGNIEIFSEFQLPDGSRAFIITTTYRTPAGTDIGLTGLNPDVVVEADWDMVSPSNDSVMDAAVRLLSGQG